MIYLQALLLLPLALAGTVGTPHPTQSVTSQSSSVSTRTTPLLTPNGSRAPSSAQATKTSSRSSPAATSPLPTTPSPSPRPCPAFPTSPTASRTIEVLFARIRKRLLRAGVLRNKKNWAHSGDIQCVYSDFRNHKFVEAVSGLHRSGSYFSASSEYI